MDRSLGVFDIPELADEIWSFVCDMAFFECRLYNRRVNDGVHVGRKLHIAGTQAQEVCLIWRKSFAYTVESYHGRSLRKRVHHYLDKQTLSRIEIHHSYLSISFLNPSCQVVEGYIMQSDFQVGSIIREADALHHSEVHLLVYPLPWLAYKLHHRLGSVQAVVQNTFKDSESRFFFTSQPTTDDPLNELQCFLYEDQTEGWFQVFDDADLQGHTIAESLFTAPEQILRTLDYTQIVLAQINGVDKCRCILPFLCSTPTYSNFHPDPQLQGAADSMGQVQQYFESVKVDNL